MRANARRVVAAVFCTVAAMTVLGLVALGGTDAGTGDNARAQGSGPEPPGPFPNPYLPDPTLTIPGERDGNSTFATVKYRQLKPLKRGEMDFQHYHSEAEMNWWMRKWAYEHQDIVDLEQVGTSFGGKPLYQLTITNKALGAATDKPAAYFDGGRHSGEITASEGSLYLAWKLVEGYGTDAAITRMVNEKAIYIRPNANPDGGEMYRHTAQTNRSSIRPTDNDGDGLLDDQSPTDLNGDGYITQIRRNVGAGNGTHIIDTRDPTGRTMRRVTNGEGNYVLQSESPGSDGIGGLDLHRNYPYNWRPMPGQDATGRGWTQTGAGEYPLSEPEIRSTHGFLIRNPNISAVNSMDTPADMVLRGPSTCDDEECVKPADIKLLERFDKVGQELTGYTRAGNVYYDYAVQPSRQGEGSTGGLRAIPTRCSATVPTSATSSTAPSGTATSTGSPAAACRTTTATASTATGRGSAGAPSAASRTATCRGRSSTTRRSARSRSVASTRSSSARTRPRRSWRTGSRVRTSTCST